MFEGLKTGAKNIFQRIAGVGMTPEAQKHLSFRDFTNEMGRTTVRGVDTVIPGLTEFTRTTGNIFGEGLAYAIDSNVREQYSAGNTDVLPYITRTTLTDLAKKTGAAGLEMAVFKSIGPAMRMKLLPRIGAGALQGIGSALAEGLARDKSTEEILSDAQSRAKYGAAFMAVSPYLMKVLGKPIKEVPGAAKQAASGLVKEIKQAVPAGIKYKYPKAFEAGIKSAQITGGERMKMAQQALTKRFNQEAGRLGQPGTLQHATYNLPGAKVGKQLVTKQAADGSTYKMQENRLTFKAADYSKQQIRDAYSRWQSPASMSLWQDNVPITKGKFGNVIKNLYYPQQEAIGNKAAFQKVYAQKAITINKQFGLKGKDGEVVGKVLDVIPDKDLTGLTSKQIIAKYGDLKGFKGITDKHINAAKGYRPLLEELRLADNKIRQLLDLPEMGKLDRYLPHMEKVSAWDRVVRTDPATKADKVRDFLIPSKVVNKHALHRVNDVLKTQPEKNLFSLYDRYVSTIGRDIYYNPAIRHMTTQTAELDRLGLGKTAEFWNDQIRQGMVGQVPSIWGIPPAVFEKLATIRAQAAIPGNLLWAHTVQPSSWALTIKDQGWKDAHHGAMKWFTNSETKRQIANMASYKIKTAKGAETILEGSIGRYDHMVYQPLSAKWTNIAGTPINAMERQLTGMSAAAGLEHGAKLGFKGKELQIYASMAADMSQSMYNAGSRPLILNNPAFRFIFPFKTFVLEAQSHALELVGKAKAPVAGSLMNKMGYRLGIASNLITSAYLFNKYNEAVRGTPVYVPGSFAWFSEPVEYAIEKLTGKKISRFGYKPDLAPYRDYEQLLKAAEEATDVARKLQIEGHSNTIELGKAAAGYMVSGDMKTFRQQLLYWSMGLRGFAGANQINKTIDGIIAAEKGYVEDRAGAEIFQVDGIKDKASAVLFGPWASKTGQEYIKENEELQKGLLEQRQQKDDTTSLAEYYTKKIKAMPDAEEKEAAWNYLSQEFPEVAEEMMRLDQIEQKGLTATDKTLLNFNVKNWARAKEIERMLRAMSAEKRMAFYQEKREKKIISDEVAKQLEYLFELKPLN